MEMVGMTVRKRFPGLESISGVVDSYDTSTGHLNILYSNGVFEEVGLDQIASIIETGQRLPSVALPHRIRRGRPPKKRPRFVPNDQHVLYGIFADDTRNTFCTDNGELGGLSQTDELGTDAVHVADVDHSSESAFMRGPDVAGACMEEVLPDYCSIGEKHDEYLSGEGVLVDLEMKNEDVTRQRRKLSGQVNPIPDSALRRSARHANNTLVCPPDALVHNNASVIQNGETLGEQVESSADDSKSAFPRSSSDLDVDGLPVLDLFTVYSFLRSFSRSLFLSPFTLEALVASLRSKYANRLIDSVHFSLLHALKSHLKLLMEEDFKPAYDCLRNLNWDFIDLLTWPLFLVEYMLFCGSAMRVDFKLSHFKYYEQPARVKLEILRCLCDDVIDVEFLRLELNKRVTDDLILDHNNIMTYSGRQRYISRYDGENSIAPQEIDVIADGNSDECCLCRMDGNLICCDGCPAAFHSRCVGVVKDLLPEGEWYCPECLVNKDRVVSFLMPFKGADFLGRDSHGRLFYGCCGYLLVSDSYDSSVLCHYYNKNDIVTVINILKSEPSPFNEVRYAISAYWEIPINDTCCNGQYENGVHSPKEILDGEMLVNTRSSSTEINGFDNFIRVGERCTAPIIARSEKLGITDSIQPGCIISMQLEEMPRVPEVSEPVGNKLNDISLADSSETNDFNVCVNSTSHPAVIATLKPTDQIVGKDDNFEYPGWSHTSKKKVVASQFHSDPFSYINYYSFGQVAAAMAEEILPKPSDSNIKDPLRSDEVIKSDQLKAICKKFTQWCWYSSYNLMVHIQKEDCGWCFTCRRLTDDECLLKTVDNKYLEGFKTNLEDFTHCTGVDSEKNKKSHVAFAMRYILSIESRVWSLLSGPWEKLHYHEQWHRAILEAYDIRSLKLLLLSLESNLRRVALLAEWMKPADTDQDGGFASFRLAGFHWWRGRKLSRQLFCWRMLPRSLVSKCSRQAGHKKIPNLFYHDGSEFSKRSKCISWQVAVERSDNVAELIYRVKDLDSNIKWAEISSTHFFSQFTKESKKIEKLFKQVLVRKKCIQGTEVKYLLDFGKREIIPAIVTKYGVLLEECTDNRKRFWLGETYVPLNLVRAFEEKKLSRLSKKKDSGQGCGKQCIVTMKKSKKSKGFTYLFSRVRNSEKHRCGHCSKDVLLREAVNCRYCDGLFHRKHFRVPKGAAVTTYTCFKCKENDTPNAKSESHKIASRKRKASVSRKGNPISISMKSKENPDSLGEKLKGPAVLYAKKSKAKQPLMSQMVSSVRKSNKNQLSSAKKSNENRVSFFRKSKENLVAIQCRKNPVRVARNLKQITISMDKKSKIIRRKRKHMMKRKKKTYLEKGRILQPKIVESLRSYNFISWYKKKRSVLRHSYWLNGLLWLNDSTNDRGRCFRDKKVFLPMQPAEDAPVKPMCCLCHRDYNVGLIFVCCEGCGDWFHGEAFGLELESICNLAGFKCPKCRMKNVPVCPFSKYPTHYLLR